jgi:hypothetical protein
MNAKKPSNLRFEDFKQRLEELNDYLPYLPGPLNQHLGDDQLFVTLKKCVPAWQEKYTDSNARKNIDNVNDLADCYGNLENQEKKERNRDNQHSDRIRYVAEDNEDTEPTIEKTYRDDLIPLQGELLNTKIAEPTVTPIPKQEIDYHPEIVLAIPKDPQAKRFTFLQALVDSRSNKCHVKLSKMPTWIQDQALPTKDECPFTGWGSSFQANYKVILPFQLTQFAPNRKIKHQVFLSNSGSDSPTSLDMILGCDLIRKLGLDLKFNDDTPANIWEDVEVPMVPRGHWTPAQIDEAFTTILEPPSTL